MPSPRKHLKIIDSHTAGEPTRVVIEGGPDLGDADLPARRERFRNEFDAFRTAIVCEPRGSDAWVGALLCEPQDSACEAGVIFFNNVGYIGMCGHGMMGLAATLAYLGRIQAGSFQVETPVGVVGVTLHEDGRISLQNVPSYRYRKQAVVDVPGHGEVRGDIAWGGNWFFLVEHHNEQIEFANLERLNAFTWQIRRALVAQNITGADGGEIDHIELFGPPSVGEADSKNFVLCPGGAYDRSPCGTGTSAKLACLAADGKLAPGDVWRQESIIGSLFEASYQQQGERIVPTLSGRAFVTAESTFVIDPEDPLAWGIRS